MTAQRAAEWVGVCAWDDLQPERGVAALIGDEQVAIVRTFDDTLYAVGNLDPFSDQYVLSRGIVGTAGDRPTLASPLYKQAFDLTTGECTTDPGVRVPVYAIRRNGDVVEVQQHA